MKPGLSAPSVTSLLAAGVVALAVGLARCPGAAGGPAPGTASSPLPESPAPASSPAEVESVGPEPSAADVADSRAPASGEKKRYVVAIVGDSLTDAQVGGGKFIAHVAKRCPESRFTNFAKGGAMVNQMRKRFERELSGASGYTHLLVFGGVNDLYSDLTAGRTPEKIEKDLGYMYEKAHERGWKVIAITVAPWGGFSKYYNASRAAATRSVNDWIRSQLTTHGVDYVVDAFPMLSCGDADKLCPEYAAPMKDGLHFGPKGHEKLGQALYETVFADCR